MTRNINKDLLNSFKFIFSFLYHTVVVHFKLINMPTQDRIIVFKDIKSTQRDKRKSTCENVFDIEYVVMGLTNL